MQWGCESLCALRGHSVLLFAGSTEKSPEGKNVVGVHRRKVLADALGLIVVAAQKFHHVTLVPGPAGGDLQLHRAG